MKLIKIVIEVYLKEDEKLEDLLKELEIDHVHDKDIDSFRIYDKYDNQIA